MNNQNQSFIIFANGVKIDPKTTVCLHRDKVFDVCMSHVFGEQGRRVIFARYHFTGRVNALVIVEQKRNSNLMVYLDNRADTGPLAVAVGLVERYLA